MVSITEEELTQFLEDKGFKPVQIEFVFDEIAWFGADYFDKAILFDYGFNMWQIRFLLKFFTV